MRARTAEWFETKIKYEKTMEDGMQKAVIEAYTVDALSFTEAEQRIMEEMSSYISGAFEVKDIKKATYKEIFDEKTEKEKRSNVYYLVQASTFQGAVKNIDQVMGGTMIDYVIASLAETQLMDVFEYKKVETKNDKPEYEQ